MKNLNLVKNTVTLLILCFTLAGTTSCKKDSINPTGNNNAKIDQRLVGKWEKQNFLGNNVSAIQETFNANGTGTERTFDLNDGATQITNEKIVSFTWFVKSSGVIHIKTQNNDEADIAYFVTDNQSALRLTLPNGNQIIFARLN